MTLRASSEAIFGSWVRGDSDRLSDRDILLVDSDLPKLRARRETLSREGWSVACYTYDKLKALSALGALFLQHLKLESRIIKDNDGLLKSILDDFKPKQTYSKEIEVNRNLAALASYRPSSLLGDLWAADVLYVSLRNHAIMLLAEQGRYLFSYQNILIHLVEYGIITKDSLGPLMQLRRAKSLYRSANYQSHLTIKALLREAIASCPLDLAPMDFTEAPPAEVLERTSSLPDGAPAYHRLRSMERSYIALQELDPSAKKRAQLKSLRNWISNPREYAVYASKQEESIIRLLNDLKNSNFVFDKKLYFMSDLTSPANAPV